MAYATQADIVPDRLTEVQLVELTNDDSDGETVVDSVVDNALTEASGIIDSYCRMRYKTPLPTPTGQLVRSLTLDIAIYNLFSRRRETKLTDTIATRYNAAIAFLKDVSKGNASLDVPENGMQPQASGETLISKRRQKFDDCNLQGWN